MKRWKALGSTLLVLSLALFPACGALFELGGSLAAIDRMHRELEGPPTTESIATYEVDPTTSEAHVRFHSVVVRR